MSDNLRRASRALVEMTIHHRPPSDYFVIVTCQGATTALWHILRRPPMNVRLYGVEFKTGFVARLAGEKALRRLLVTIADGHARRLISQSGSKQ